MQVKIKKLLPELETMKKYHNGNKYMQYFESKPPIDVYQKNKGIIGQVVFNDNLKELAYDSENIFPESTGITKLTNGQLILIELAAGTEIAIPVSCEEAREKILKYNKKELLEDFGLF